MMPKTEWLDSLKAGDEVLYSVGWGGSAVRYIETVERTTATQIILGRARFRRKDGRRVGAAELRYGSIREPTDADREQIERERLRQDIAGRWRTIEHRDSLSHVPLQLLRDVQSKMEACLRAYKSATVIPSPSEEE